MNFKKLCSDLLKSNKKIRFTGVLNYKGNLVAQKSRDNSISLLSDDELKMLVYYTSDRWNRLQNLQHKLGNVKESITKFENVTTIILFLGQNLFLISIDPNSNNSKIASNLWKIIDKKPAKKRTAKKKHAKRKPAKKRTAKKKPVKRKPAKKRTAKKKPVKRKPAKKRTAKKKPVSRRP